MTNRWRSRRGFLPLGWVARAWVRRVGLSAVAAVCGMTLATVLWGPVESLVQVARSHPYFSLSSVEIRGNHRLSREEVLQWAGVQEGTSIWDAVPGTLQLRLQSHPWIAQASAQRDFPSHLRLRVRERIPAAIVRFGELMYVDREGHVLGMLRPDDTRDLPVITGLEGTDAHGFTSIAIHRALQLLHWCARANCFDTISEVHIDRYRGVTVFPLRTAVAVVLGWGSWHEKLARTGRVFAAWEGQVERLAVVDVSYRDIVVIKLQEEHRLPAVRKPKRGHGASGATARLVST